MKALVLGGLIAALAACGSNVPAHPSCATNADCSGSDVCHFPPGGASGVCVVTCTSASGCPSSEPWCIPDVDSSSSPFSFCGCATIGPDAGVSTGCGDNQGYGCSPELQVCLPR